MLHSYNYLFLGFFTKSADGEIRSWASAMNSRSSDSFIPVPVNILIPTHGLFSYSQKTSSQSWHISGHSRALRKGSVATVQ